MAEVDQENDDVSVLAINVGEDYDTVKQFVEAGDYALTVLLDPQALLSRKYLIGGVPTTYYIDAEGRNLGAYQGLLPKDRAQMFVDAIRNNRVESE